MKSSLIIRWLSFIFIMFSLTSAFNLKAETKPRWVSKGVKELNEQRSNTTYSFHVFHLQDERKSQYKYDSYMSLENYIDSVYNISRKDIKISQVEMSDRNSVTYLVSFEKENRSVEIYAMLVDSFSQFEDFANGSFDYNIWQLFAISEPNVYPEFDDFIKKDKYHAGAVAMSIIPGLGQIYKGQKTKGYVIMGAEAAMIASIVYATTQANKWNRLAYQNKEFFDSYQSKADSYRGWRTFSYIAGGSLYLYNLLDAAISKGARYIEIKRKNDIPVQLSLYPSYIIDSPGLTVGLKF